MTNKDPNNIDAPRRKRTRGSKKKKRRSISSSNIIGICMMLFGLVMCLQTFDLMPTKKSLFAIDLSDMVNLWPVYIILIGFVVVIRDLIKQSDLQKWK